MLSMSHFYNAGSLTRDEEDFHHLNFNLLASFFFFISHPKFL